MKTKIYYLTRSYSPYQKGGGPLMRTSAVAHLQELKWDISVVMPNYNSKELIIENNIIQIPFKGTHIQKLTTLLERVGVYEDYLDKWIIDAYDYLKKSITRDDIIFSTSGGELGMIKLGSLLKEESGCKFIVNFRDPLNYGEMNGLKKDKKFHVSREKALQKYIYNADLILTSSQFYEKILKLKFPYLKNNIINNYFGYIKPINTNKYIKKTSNKLRIAYSGSMISAVQKPETLYSIFKKVNFKIDIEIYFIGDYHINQTLTKINSKNIKFIDFMPHEEFLKFMYENIDVGFLSLANNYYGACIPSKFYEYINLELPILAALPNGDASDLINANGYGYSCHYNDIDSLANALVQLNEKKQRKQFSSNIIKDKNKWAMETRIKEVNHILQKWVH